MEILTFAYTNLQSHTLGQNDCEYWNIQGTNIIAIGWQIVAGGDSGGLMATQCFIYNNGSNGYIKVNNISGVSVYTVQISITYIKNSSDTNIENTFKIENGHIPAIK